MQKPVIISPSILSADFSILRQQLEEATQAGMDWIHVDVMDGSFVPNISMGPFMVETLKKISPLPLDVHLMINNPERHLEAFHSAGADNLTVHIECNPNIHRTLYTIRKLGCHPGIAINPGTPVSTLDSIFEFIDLVLVMTVNPGYSGQEFIPHMLKKINHVYLAIQKINPKILLGVDGGISVETAPLTYNNGARVFVAGNAVFKHPQGVKTGIENLRMSLM
jgi:ribulose-phosphate 3-epimerase